MINICDLHLLVVEDDDFQRRIIIKMLQSLGVTTISEACNGREALETVRRAGSRPVQITISDLKMPEMDGMEFMRHLGEEGHKIAIIAITTLDGKLLSSVGRMTRMYGLKLLGTIEKPVIMERLKELLDSYALSERKWKRTQDARAFTLEEIQQGMRANQFELFFQPKVDAKTGRLVGAEGLARWIHPEHGTIGPCSFIPQLERSGSIDELTFLMLDKALAACRMFCDRGQPLSIAMNLSASLLDDPGLAGRITQVAKDAGIGLEHIVLEITESAAMTDVARAIENLARLKMNGFTLSIDDYGTGYSNVQQLARIAFGELKIDQSFVKDCNDNETMRIIVESSIEMARKLGMKSVAEGVETQRDWDLLKCLGVDTIQGYLIAKPMDIETFKSFATAYPH